MSIKGAPSIENDVIKPMEDISSTFKEFLITLIIGMKSIINYFWILFTPICIYFIVFQIEIYHHFLNFVGRDVYTSGVIIFTCGFSLCCWLYKSALFADKDNENLKKIIFDNTISFITLAYISYDLYTDFVVYQNSMGITKEQFYMVKSLIFTCVLVDFWLGVRAGYRYYRDNKDLQLEDTEDQESSQSDQIIGSENGGDDELDADNENNSLGYNKYKNLKFLLIAIPVIIVLAIVLYYINNGI